MKVLGVILDCKLQWAPQVSQAISKAKRALHAIKLIKPYFSSDELRQLLASKDYFNLY